MPKFLPPEYLVTLRKSTHMRECFLAVEASFTTQTCCVLKLKRKHSTNFKKKKKRLQINWEAFLNLLIFLATLFGSVPSLFLNLFYRLTTDFSGPHSTWFIPPSSLQLAVMDHTSLLPKTPLSGSDQSPLLWWTWPFSKWFLPLLFSAPPQSHHNLSPPAAPQGYLCPPGPH